MEEITLAVVQRAVAGDDGGVLCRQVQRRRDEASPHRPIANSARTGSRCDRGAAGEVPRSTVGDIEATTGPTHPQQSRWVVGAQGRNRTTDTGIFSPSKSLGELSLPCGDVRQALRKPRQARYAEARSCTVRPVLDGEPRHAAELLSVVGDRRQLPREGGGLSGLGPGPLVLGGVGRRDGEQRAEQARASEQRDVLASSGALESDRRHRPAPVRMWWSGRRSPGSACASCSLGAQEVVDLGEDQRGTIHR
jgi:hypothetical protein